ncbi:MAG: hypothetical protein U9P14_10240, partial [Gemmatimonadota bacterium]|nr:hypothetical protein [Gemmatimonadota bacterium]
ERMYVLLGHEEVLKYCRQKLESDPQSLVANFTMFYLARINGARHPDYHSMNFRIDRRYNFKNSNLILYWDFWNTYKRKNIANYYWNELENKQDREDQWGFMPVFGLEWEF